MKATALTGRSDGEAVAVGAGDDELGLGVAELWGAGLAGADVAAGDGLLSPATGGAPDPEQAATTNMARSDAAARLI